MIVYPEYWRDIGRPVKLKEIEDTIIRIIQEMDCDCLALSGGLDSSLLLYYMHKIIGGVKAFTIGQSKNHPDVQHARLAVRGKAGVDLKVFIPSKEEAAHAQEAEKIQGDGAVRLFYKFVAKFTDVIATGDGIDEFMCGYYDHQENPNEETYHKYIRQLREKHLEPLNRNSDRVKVYLPYLDFKLLFLLSQVPIAEKVTFEQRKTLVVAMAENKIPNEIINRRKYGFCDALRIRD